MLGRLSRGLVRSFCSNKPLQQTGSSAITEPNRSNEIPIHLRPYDKKKYEVLMDKIKLNSGYAFMEVEPFPRAKIMKVCYHIMEQLSIGFPQDCVYRIFNEERTKYFMKLVDETTDIEQLEEFLAVETIELFIDNLVGQLEVINAMRTYKIWEYENDDSFDPNYMDGIAPEPHIKNPAYKKPERPKNTFVEE